MGPIMFSLCWLTASCLEKGPRVICSELGTCWARAGPFHCGTEGLHVWLDIYPFLPTFHLFLIQATFMDSFYKWEYTNRNLPTFHCEWQYVPYSKHPTFKVQPCLSLRCLKAARSQHSHDPHLFHLINVARVLGGKWFTELARRAAGPRRAPPQSLGGICLCWSPVNNPSSWHPRGYCGQVHTRHIMSFQINILDSAKKYFDKKKTIFHD